ncbi:MAG: hypothetical protein LQ338_006943 [Usnochroma carphineum]|nr:MAG: hypothetical protein LQ338_006943 [Usnochroma carphineum]
MLSRSALRASKASNPSTMLARRGFHSTPARLSSPYHYAEGPLSNIPFNPRTKYFGVRYWGTMAFFFGLPFGIAVWQTYKNV